MKQNKRDFNTDLYFQTVEIKKKDWKKRLEKKTQTKLVKTNKVG